MTGTELDARIKLAADNLCLVAIHFPDSRRVSAPGWVDWVLIGARGVLFREAKGDGDTLSGQQRALGYTLQANGLDWALWTPRDLRDLTISRELEQIAARPKVRNGS